MTIGYHLLRDRNEHRCVDIENAVRIVVSRGGIPYIATLP